MVLLNARTQGATGRVKRSLCHGYINVYHYADDRPQISILYVCLSIVSLLQIAPVYFVSGSIIIFVQGGSGGRVLAGP